MAWLFPVETKDSLRILAKIGLIFLLFQGGMELDCGRLRTRSRTVVAVYAFGIAGPFICGLLAGPWLQRELAPDVPLLGFRRRSVPSHGSGLPSGLRSTHRGSVVPQAGAHEESEGAAMDLAKDLPAGCLRRYWGCHEPNAISDLRHSPAFAITSATSLLLPADLSPASIRHSLESPTSRPGDLGAEPGGGSSCPGR
jgi:hypothetical protein